MKTKISKHEPQLTEMSRSQLSETHGGFFGPIFLGTFLKLIVDEWDTSKRAAVDAWNGNYNPPAN